MAARLQDYCAEVVPSPGTGAITCPGTAVAGGKTFTSTFSNGDLVYYQLISATTPQIEVGIGTWNSAGTLARTTVLWNTSGTTSPLNIVNTATCVCDIPAQRRFFYDDNILIPLLNQGPMGQDLLQNALQSPSEIGQTFKSGQWNAVKFDTAVLSETGAISGSSPYSSFTIPNTGFWRLQGAQFMQTGAASAGGVWGLGIQIDSTIVASRQIDSNGAWQYIDWLGQINSGQVVQLVATKNLGGSIPAAADCEMIIYFQGDVVDIVNPTTPTNSTGRALMLGYFSLTQLSF